MRGGDGRRRRPTTKCHLANTAELNIHIYVVMKAKRTSAALAAAEAEGTAEMRSE